MTVYEADGAIVVVDAGLAFPRDEHLGVDLVLPDFSYLTGPRPARARDRAHARPRGPRRRAAVPAAPGRACRRSGRPSSRSASSSRSSTSTGCCAPSSCARPTPRARRSSSGRSASSSSAMAHSIPDAVAIVLETPGRPHRPHRRLQARPHARRRPAHRRRPARRARHARSRPAARRLHERRAPGRHRLRAPGRRGVPPDHPPADRPRPGCVLRVEHPPHAAGGRRGCRRRAEGLLRRPLDAQERQHRAATSATSTSPTTSSIRPNELDDLRAATADPLHREPGRADLGDRADRVRRPPRVSVEAGDTVIISASRSPETSCASTTRSTGSRRSAPRCCTRTSRRCTSPAMGTRRSCARCSGSSGRRR